MRKIAWGKFKALCINLGLFIVSLLLFFLFASIGLVTASYQILFNGASTEYFRDNALSVDMWGNVYCQHLFNWLLITRDSKYKFGQVGVTISAVLGLNQREGTLSNVGVFVANTLDKIDKDHCKNSIRE